jgi:hypothetical protein
LQPALHVVLAPGTHAPFPSQAEAAVATAFEQAAGAHVVVAPGYVHANEVPSQRPPHTPLPVQARAPSGGPVTGMQWPPWSGRLQAPQGSAQEVSQQTPSAQWPVEH